MVGYNSRQPRAYVLRLVEVTVDAGNDPADGEAEKVLTFLDALEEHEDVQRVFSNAECDEAQLEALA